ncbi:Uncharacterised protein [Escherichia coli]|nr:Uncharacterised protein [Escherichia coli]
MPLHLIKIIHTLILHPLFEARNQIIHEKLKE